MNDIDLSGLDDLLTADTVARERIRDLYDEETEVIRRLRELETELDEITIKTGEGARIRRENEIDRQLARSGSPATVQKNRLARIAELRDTLIPAIRLASASIRNDLLIAKTAGKHARRDLLVAIERRVTGALAPKLALLGDYLCLAGAVAVEVQRTGHLGHVAELPLGGSIIPAGDSFQIRTGGVAPRDSESPEDVARRLIDSATALMRPTAPRQSVQGKPAPRRAAKSAEEQAREARTQHSVEQDDGLK